jgi:hypothetical protein
MAEIVNMPEVSNFAEKEGEKGVGREWDQVSLLRTSMQHWCDDANGCTSRPTIKEVTRWMVEIGQMPEVSRPTW